MFLWSSFPSNVADVSDAWPIVYSFWKGENVDQDQAALAAFNVAGLGYKLGFGKKPQPMQSAPASTEEVNAAFATVIPTVGSKAKRGASGDPKTAIPWAILWPIALEFIKKYLKF